MMIGSIGIYNGHEMVKKSGEKLNNSISKLATGKKDLVKDSPADFHVVKSLEQRVRTSEIAMRNISTASNMLKIAEGSLQHSIDRLISLKKEAVIFNDGSVNEDQKEAILDRMNEIGDEILNLLNSTNFNGYDIFNTDSFDFQVGSDSSDTISIEFDISNLNLIFSKDPLVDLAIIMDNSGSLAEEQEGIQNNLENLVNQLESENINLALGLTRFGADENSGSPIVGSLTTDSDDFINNIWNENTLDGFLEPTFEAIQKTAEDMDFRTGSSRFLMVVGDEDPNQGNITESQALNAVKDIAGNLITVTDPYYFSEFENITEDTNGKEININNDFGSVLEEVKSQILDSSTPDFITQINDNLNILLGLAQKIGNTQNRLDKKETNLSNHILNTENSRSRIEDVDFAKETMKKMKAELLLQSSNNIFKQQMDSMQFILKLFN